MGWEGEGSDPRVKDRPQLPKLVFEGCLGFLQTLGGPLSDLYTHISHLPIAARGRLLEGSKDESLLVNDGLSFSESWHGSHLGSFWVVSWGKFHKLECAPRPHELPLQILSQVQGGLRVYRM